MARQALPNLTCACATIRRAARLVTQLYSAEIDGALEPGQYALLTALNQHPGSAQAPIGRALGLDKTTLSRNLSVLQKNGWIERSVSNDQRERTYQLTAAGKKLVKSANAGWTAAQTKLHAALPGEWETMFSVFNRVAGAALAAKQDSSNSRATKKREKHK